LPHYLNPFTLLLHPTRMQKLTACPVCGSTDIRPTGLTVPDHSLTQQVFSLDYCTACSLRFTNPRPPEDAIGEYYAFAEYISHTDDAPGIINKLYRLARRWTTDQKVALITREAERSAPKTLLDYGCGTGYFLRAAQLAGWEIDGVEVSSVARAAASSRTTHAIAAELASIPPHSTYQIITLWHVLEHIHDLNTVFAELLGRLVPGGTLVVAVPNYQSADAKHYGPHWAAYDVPRHLYHFSQESIRTLAHRNGARVETVIRQPMDAFYIGLLSEKYRQGNPISGLIQGFMSNLRALSTGEYSSLIYVIRRG
jgi:2-polyprenyl-3-methyl-5-hydroxy-6-metoxy-1,4-benzoquinol methylase